MLLKKFAHTQNKPHESDLSYFQLKPGEPI